MMGMTALRRGLRVEGSQSARTTQPAAQPEVPAEGADDPASIDRPMSVGPHEATAHARMMTDEDRRSARARFAASASLVRFVGADVTGLSSSPSGSPATPVAPLTFTSDTPSLVGTTRLGPAGSMDFDTGIRPYTRSYAQATAGPLRRAHGSPAPLGSPALSAEDRAALSAQTPGQALDSMAKTLGVDGLGFDSMAHSKDFFDPAQKSWWGLCAQWSWSSLNPKLSQKVDVPGPDNERGAWLAGQWISRADLGNWAMATSKSFVDVATLNANAQSLATPTAVDLVRSMSALRPGGPGFIMDVHNDKARGTAETWNQPVFAAHLEQRAVPAHVTAALIEKAAAAGHTGMTDAKLVTIKAKYGIEKSDGYEGDAAVASTTWNAYVVTNADGDVRWGWMANDNKLADIPGLPVKTTDAPPDYLVLAPTTIIDEAMAGISSRKHHKYGAEFDFFMGTVLPHMVPGTVRTEFEAQVAAHPSGPLPPEAAAQLAQQFHGVASAYAPEQWQRTFAVRGLDAETFGAVWAVPR